ncbi:recombination regulator RecX [Thiotrichales bacterium 19S3-7]|nr:recombination regulator RecX [Thiotrichales bacterium 19S3-7]MCF6802766.1 recombination regulator RecX [Thiotrichales bacterium 19S3-11]
MINSDYRVKKAKSYAISLLAKREYAAQELKQKLINYQLTENEIDSLLVELAEKGFQSDFRFAESLVRFNLAQNRGRYRIIGELKQKGIDADLFETVISEIKPNWHILCLKRIEKYVQSSDALNDFKVMEKLKRYLVYHGFSFDEINYAIKQMRD